MQYSVPFEKERPGLMQIVVLGMHRSGTSALARVLGLIGAYVGEPSEMNQSDAANPRGYWERREVVALDEAILAALDASWYEPLAADPARLEAAERAAFERRARSILSSLDGHRPWAVKDPRLCLLFPFWRALLDSPVCALVHRDPIEVARSLRTRDGFPLPLGLALWEAHARAALAGSAGLPRVLVSYTGLVDDPVGTAARLSKQLIGLGVPLPRAIPEAELLDFVSSSLRRERSEPGEERGLLTPAQSELLEAFAGPDLPPGAAPGRLSAGAQDLLEAFSRAKRAERATEAVLRAEAAARAEDVRRFTRILAERDALVASLGGPPGTPEGAPSAPAPAATAASPGRTDLTVCTIVAKNYLAMARVLCRSFLAHHPGARAFVLLADEVEGAFDPAQEPFELVEARDLGVPDFQDLAFRYDLLELSTSLKPAFLLHLLETKGVTNLVYLDPDVFVHAPLEEVRRSLETHDVVLTPHILQPIRPDGRRPAEKDLVAAGVFNLGFIAVRRSPAALALLDWWGARLHDGAYLDFASGLFTDQKWMNLAPCFLDGLVVLRHRGYNVAYWNFQERSDLERTGGGWTVGGEPLRFVHFSGLDPDQPNLVSKHQDRFRLADLGRGYRELFTGYVHALEGAGLARARELRCRYSAFDDGTPIPEMARRLFRDLGDERRRFGDPFRTGPGSFLEWLRAPRREGSPVTHLADYLYQQRVDVVQAFPEPDGAHALALHEWLVAWAGKDFRLEQAWVDAFDRTRGRLEEREDELRRDAERAAKSAAAERTALEIAARAKAEAEAEATVAAQARLESELEAKNAAAASAVSEAKAEADRRAAALVAAAVAALAEEARRDRLTEANDEPKAEWKRWVRAVLGSDRYRRLRELRWRVRSPR